MQYEEKYESICILCECLVIGTKKQHKEHLEKYCKGKSKHIPRIKRFDSSIRKGSVNNDD